jgi:O-6-methylguanine DNA methyltransferase
MVISEFQKLVYETVKKIPFGQVLSYKQVAKSMGKPKSFRAVGNALNKNPFAPKVPCHRVIRSDGKVGGFVSGQAVKIKLLKKEGIIIKNNKIINLKNIK